MILAMLACTAEDSAVQVATGPDTAPLEAPRLLRRMSLDLRGVLPTVEELDAVEADPTQLGTIRDTYLDDPRLEERLVLLFGERWATRVDAFNVGTPDYKLDPSQEYELARAVGEEPLRLAAHIATNDLPWTELVTADYTLANELLASVWPLDREDGDGWQIARYNDGRPAAGVLATNGLWWRYTTTMFNFNRARGAAVSRLLLCQDFLDRPVTFSAAPSLLDEDGTNTATRTDPSCLACHAPLDPIGAALFGFWDYDQYDVNELTRYHPEREPLYDSFLGVAPAWFGTPIAGLNELGPVIAADPRFIRCAAQSTAEALWRRPEELGDFDEIEGFRDALMANDLHLRAVLQAVTDGPTYQAGSLTDTADADAEARERTVRLLTPEQMASTVTDLTGFTWTWEHWAQMDNDLSGYRVMAGGMDGLETTRPSGSPSVTWAIAAARLAEAGASTVASAETNGGAPLLDLVDLDTQPTDAAFTDQMETLYWRLYGERPTDEWTSSITQLWTVIAADEGPANAWAAVLTAMLRDPAMLAY